MTRSHHISKWLHDQRGMVIILFALCLPVLLGLAALAVDLARLNLTRTELQNAADAAALGGAKSLKDASVKAADKPYNWTAANNKAIQLARANFANGRGINDVTIDKGYWNLQTRSFTLLPASGVPAGNLPAIRVTIEISSTKNNGPLPLFFAPILGIATSNVKASAVTILNGMGGPFNYALFSGSTSDNLTINGSGLYIRGSAHTNKKLIINGSSITITEAAEAVGTITTNGSNINIGSRLPGSNNMDMPDFSESITTAATAANQKYNTSYTINGSNITSDPIYVTGENHTVTVNGSSFTATGAVMADGNITINGSGVSSGNNQVCFYSKDGDIIINGSSYALNGVLYAPNGRIIINGSGVTVNGSVVGEEITINGSGFNIDRTNYPITSLPGSNVLLVE
ncbi:MAG: hypothetical protein HGB20_03275 [Chlorobiaceae bacterium]|nr:hypothetical protein [Chlorobiaceae bacterium]